MNIKKPLIYSLKKTKRKIVKNILNMQGWSTPRKLVIFESDDWGSIRMPSRAVYDYLLKTGDKVDCDPFTRYDSLASESDLSLLFEVLSAIKDCKGNPPVITANCAVANPDFEKIRDSGFQTYYYEPFTETLNNYPDHKKSFELWKQGMERKLFFPQFHCREHLNVTRWMRDLQMGKSDVVKAFDHKMISTGDSFSSDNIYAYMDAFNYDNDDEQPVLNLTLQRGLDLFEKIFGYCSKSFIASCYIWGNKLEKELCANGIEYIQGKKIQFVPTKEQGTSSLGETRHFLGQKNAYNQIYLLRNCEFEPSMNQNVDWIDNCMCEIETAFHWNKPVTICTHRLNYIGYIDKGNREKNLKLLSLLLSKIMKKWPDVEFVTSAELGDMIKRMPCA